MKPTWLHEHDFVEEFIDTEYNYRRYFMRSIWDFNILLEINICKTVIINMHNKTIFLE